MKRVSLLHSHHNFRRVIMMKIIIISVLIGVSLGFGVHYDVYKQKDCPGNLIEQGVYDTVLQCLQRCDALDNCVAVTRRVADKKCVFKSACDLYNLQTPNCLCTLYARPPHVYEIEANNDCPGNSIRTLTDSDVAACIRLCDSIPDCVAFFRNLKGTCWLKDACTAKERSKLGNLYLNDLGQFQYLPDAECVSKNIAQIQASSPGQCIRACVDRKGCVAVVYGRDSEKCMLKGECGKITLNRKDDVYLSPDSGILAAITSGHDCGSVNGVCRKPGQCLPNEEECTKVCEETGRVCCCKKGDAGIGDCGSVGGHCRVAGKCETGENKCSPKCGTGKGLVCCCRVRNKRECKANKGSCRNAGQCKKDEETCGQCGSGIGRVCCCKRIGSGSTCSSIGGTCAAEMDSCVEDCPNQKCMAGKKCCCRVVDGAGETCSSRGNTCTAPAQCKKTCSGTCPLIGSVCCCGN